MAFKLDGLKRIGTGAAHGTGRNAVVSSFMYATTDTAAVVETAGYFNPMAAEFVPGDQIDASMAIGAGVVRKSYVVTAIAAGVVTIALQTTTAG